MTRFGWILVNFFPSAGHCNPVKLILRKQFIMTRLEEQPGPRGEQSDKVAGEAGGREEQFVKVEKTIMVKDIRD